MPISNGSRNAVSPAELAVSIAMTVGVIAVVSKFMLFIETRPGMILPDPIIAMLPVHDWTWPIFLLMYGGLFTGIYALARRPHRLNAALQAYVIMLLARAAGMYLLPLDPPAGLIPLRDPIVGFFGPGEVLTRDLFFSGHTATLYLLHLAMPRGRMRTALSVITALVGSMLVWQRVHYSIDVLAAPFFTYTSFCIAGRLRTAVAGAFKVAPAQSAAPALARQEA